MMFDLITVIAGVAIAEVMTYVLPSIIRILTNCKTYKECDLWYLAIGSLIFTLSLFKDVEVTLITGLTMIIQSVIAIVKVLRDEAIYKRPKADSKEG